METCALCNADERKPCSWIGCDSCPAWYCDDCFAQMSGARAPELPNGFADDWSCPRCEAALGGSPLATLTSDDLACLIDHCDEPALVQLYATCRALKASTRSTLRQRLSLSLVGRADKHPGKLGQYVKIVGHEVPCYTKVGCAELAMWHLTTKSDSVWIVGTRSNVGKARGFLHAKCGPRVSDLLNASWKALSDKTWAPCAVRCVGAKQWDALQNDMRSRSLRVAVSCALPVKLNTFSTCFGVYRMLEYPVNGYVAYALDTRQGKPRVAMWHRGELWIIGRFADIGMDMAYAYTVEGCAVPTAAMGQWFIRETAVDVTCTEWTLPQSRGAAFRVFYSGPTAPPPLYDKYLGTYLESSRSINSLPVYEKRGIKTMNIWHEAGAWTLGSLDRKAPIAPLFARDATLALDKIRDVWLRGQRYVFKDLSEMSALRHIHCVTESSAPRHDMNWKKRKWLS